MVEYSAKHYQIKSEKSAVRAEDAANRAEASASNAEEAKTLANEAVTKLNGIDETVANAKTEITTHANTEQSEAITAITSAKNEAVTAVLQSGGVPVGSVIAFAANSAPTGFVLCNGAAVSRTTYSKLFAVIGTTYGAGDGSTTFALPNLTDKFIQGSGTAGTSKVAGLPNITGFFHADYKSSATTGAFYNNANASKVTGLAGASGSHAAGINFDASRSSGIYGKSTTVQPPALTMRYYIKY